MDPTLCLHPGQEALTTAQEAEAERFAKARIEAQLSTEPVDESEAEQLLRQAYRVAGLPPPRQIHWVDGPLQLIAVMTHDSVRASVGASRWKNTWASVWFSVGNSVGDSVNASVQASVDDRVWVGVGDSVAVSVAKSVATGVGDSVWACVAESVGENLWTSVAASVEASVWAFYEASRLAYSRFFDEYLAPNELHALAHFNELVSGYCLEDEHAVLVRRPCGLARDHEGRLHSATGKCVEYPDGWGFYAWHGVRVPEQVILAPERLTREDFLKERNLEVRRVIQERMGDRFVRELGGQVIDTDPSGTLYEVRLPADDPEQVARYVQVRDASTSRHYFPRVPPTVQTAAEAVAWSFQMTAQEYRPAQEA